MLRRLGVGCGGLFCALLVLEVAVRAFGAITGGSLDDIVGRPAPPTGRDFQLGEILRPHPSDRIVYELRPGLSGKFQGQPMRTNSLGMRGPERSIVKPPGTFRIVGLGDSVMFGWGVAEEDAYLSVVERELAARFPDRRFEVWNLAVPGYNAVQEVESFAAKVDRLDPDLVVVGWIGNDVDLPNFLAERPAPWAVDRSFLWDFVKRRWRARRHPEEAGLGLFEVPHDDETHRYVLRRDEVPERYWPLAGWDNMLGAYRKLARLTKDRAVPVVVVFAAGPRQFKSFCEAQGFVIAESQHRVLRYETEHGVDRHSALQISSRDPHPNALGHRLIAETLLESFDAAKLLAPRARAR